jgi:serine/threonine protein kinase
MSLVAHTSRTRVYIYNDQVHKYISKNSAKKRSDQFSWEIALMLELKGCNRIIQLVNYIETSKELCIIMKKPERCVDLMEYATVNYISEHIAKHFVRQIIEAIENCYKRGICHRDIKADNVVVDLDTLDILLIDFGSASYRQDVFKNFTGTFLPPEYIRYGEYKDEACSVFCIGILLYEILTALSLFNVINKGDTVMYYPSSMSFKCKNFIAQCLLENDRPTLSALSRHPWLMK